MYIIIIIVMIVVFISIGSTREKKNMELRKADFFDEHIVGEQGRYFENEFYTKVAGVTFEGRQRLVKKCKSGAKLILVREKNNPHDNNAIAIYNGNDKLGYIKKELASRLAVEIDSGKICNAYVSEVTGGYDGKSYGVNIFIQY